MLIPLPPRHLVLVRNWEFVPRKPSFKVQLNTAWLTHLPGHPRCCPALSPLTLAFWAPTVIWRCGLLALRVHPFYSSNQTASFLRVNFSSLPASLPSPCLPHPCPYPVGSCVLAKRTAVCSVTPCQSTPEMETLNVLSYRNAPAKVVRFVLKCF